MSPIGLALAVLLIAFFGLRAIWRKPAEGEREVIPALALSAILLGALALWAWGIVCVSGGIVN